MDSGSKHCTGGSEQKHPKEKVMQEGNVIEEALQIGEGSKVKGEGERERYARYAEFQRVARQIRRTF